MSDGQDFANTSEVLLPLVYQQQNLLPWRSDWVKSRQRLLVFSYVFWMLLMLCLLAAGYFLYWQRQHQWQQLQAFLQERVAVAQLQTQPLLEEQQQWLFKQAAMIDHHRWRKASQAPMGQLLLVQGILKNLNGKIRSLEMEGQSLKLQLVTPLSWEYLQSEWWLPESGYLYRVEQLGRASAEELWVLHIGIAAQP